MQDIGIHGAQYRFIRETPAAPTGARERAGARRYRVVGARRAGEGQFRQQEAELGFGLGIAGEHQLAAVGGRGARRSSARRRTSPAHCAASARAVSARVRLPAQRFVPDSPLEGDGFELPVPAGMIRASWRLANLKSVSSEDRLISSHPFQSDVLPKKAGAMPARSTLATTPEGARHTTAPRAYTRLDLTNFIPVASSAV